MKPSEKETVRKLLIDSYSFDYDLNEGYKADILDMESRVASCETWVLEENDELVATVCTPFNGEHMTDFAHDDEMDFRLLAVSPQHRRKGYGATMVEHVEKLAQHRGYKKLMLVTGPEMETAQNLYHALGFEQPKAREEYVPEFGITLLIFVKTV
ncbi:MAG: GNAT family N-acetyltransferase [Micrococcaceae bacterium]